MQFCPTKSESGLARPKGQADLHSGPESDHGRDRQARNVGDLNRDGPASSAGRTGKDLPKGQTGEMGLIRPGFPADRQRGGRFARTEPGSDPRSSPISSEIEPAMLLIRLDSLRSDMTLARPVLHPDRDDLILLNAGYVLDEPMIQKLAEMGVTNVWIRVPGFEEVQAEADDQISRNHMELYRILTRSIHDLEPRVAVKLNVQQYEGAVHMMLSSIIDRPHHDVVTNELLSCGPQLTGHMANCSYLALLLGAHLTGYLRDQRRNLPSGVAENTEQLGLGALLHDIGKLNMPDELFAKTILDDEAESPEYRFHVRSGYEAVREYLSPVAANVVLHHHERFDGNGFPGRQGPQDETLPNIGTNIHVFSRILAVVDVFDRLLCPGGRPVPTIVAIDGLRSERFNGWFDPMIIDALLRLVPPFMIGSVVTLRDGQEAAVVANHPEAPCKPTVRVLKEGPTGPLASTRQLDLRMCRDLSIAEVNGVNVEPYLYAGEFEPESVSAA